MRNGSLPWKPGLKAKADNLADAFAAYSQNDIASAVEAELRTRMENFTSGIRKYQTAPRRDARTPDPVHTIGTTRLLDFGTETGTATDAPPLLIIPSLVNRYTVLNLENGQGFIRTLADNGFRPYVVDWDAPGPEEKTFDLSDYVTNRLEPLLAFVCQHSGKPHVGLMGYCMGGLLALALASRKPEQTSTLTLLATPWDFHADHRIQVKMLATMMPQLNILIDTLGELPVDVLQALFTSLDPWLALEKFQRFARMDPESIPARSFVDLEDWLNDGVALAGPVARECLTHWYVENRPVRNLWAIEGSEILPGNISIPTISFIPEHDHIVPPASAQALADAIPGAEAVNVPSGHIGMVAGSTARDALLTPLIAWLKKNQRQ